MTINTKLIAMTIGTTLLSLIGNGLMTYESVQIERAVEPIQERNIPSLKAVSDLTLEIAQMRGNTWKHIAEQDEREMQDVNRQLLEGEKRIAAALKQVRELAETGEERQQIEKISRSLERYGQVWASIKLLSEAKNNAEAVAMHRAKMRPISDALMDDLEGLALVSRKRVSQSIELLRADADRAGAGGGGGCGAGGSRIELVVDSQNPLGAAGCDEWDGRNWRGTETGLAAGIAGSAAIGGGK